MGVLGYVGENEGNQPFEVAQKMKWLVAALYTFSAIVMFVSIAFIYNLDKKKVAIMNEELSKRRAETQSTERAVEEITAPETVLEDAANAENVIEKDE